MSRGSSGVERVGAGERSVGEVLFTPPSRKDAGDLTLVSNGRRRSRSKLRAVLARRRAGIRKQ